MGGKKSQFLVIIYLSRREKSLLVLRIIRTKLDRRLRILAAGLHRSASPCRRCDVRHATVSTQVHDSSLASTTDKVVNFPSHAVNVGLAVGDQEMAPAAGYLELLHDIVEQGTSGTEILQHGVEHARPRLHQPGLLFECRGVDVGAPRVRGVQIHAQAPSTLRLSHGVDSDLTAHDPLDGVCSR